MHEWMNIKMNSSEYSTNDFPDFISFLRSSYKETAKDLCVLWIYIQETQWERHILLWGTIFNTMWFLLDFKRAKNKEAQHDI